jgi:hypothetical protein
VGRSGARVAGLLLVKIGLEAVAGQMLAAAERVAP